MPKEKVEPSSRADEWSRWCAPGKHTRRPPLARTPGVPAGVFHLVEGVKQLRGRWKTHDEFAIAECVSFTATPGVLRDSVTLLLGHVSLVK